jgi:hypothetical protein
LVTGQVERRTDFEPGFPVQYKRSGRDWEPDYMVWDDQGVIVHVRDKGLVVMSSCSHSGVVNVLWNAQRLTGVTDLHAFVGGCHLSGALMEPVIPRTLEEIGMLGSSTSCPDTAPAGRPRTSWPASFRTPSSRAAWGRSCGSERYELRLRPSASTARAAFRPGSPVTFPPGCAPDPQRYSPSIGIR